MGMSDPIDYQPGPVPANPADLQRYLRDEFGKIAAAISLLKEGNYTLTYAEPKKMFPGLVRYVDGVNFDPDGGGEGLLMMTTAGAWLRLG